MYLQYRRCFVVVIMRKNEKDYPHFRTCNVQDMINKYFLRTRTIKNKKKKKFYFSCFVIFVMKFHSIKSHSLSIIFFIYLYFSSVLGSSAVFSVVRTCFISFDKNRWHFYEISLFLSIFIYKHN